MAPYFAICTSAFYNFFILKILPLCSTNTKTFVMKKMYYRSPAIEIVTIAVEQGIAASFDAPIIMPEEQL